ncbi:MAG: DUF262 domain-containing HNH endonuclease family protein [Bacteroidota bacterium]|nr:DUF262 domain-containing HNH endonuclease family protein [Bacteroidota bacterium]
MEQGPKIKVEAKLISQLLNSGRFEVPWHQRTYDWTEEVDDLLTDLMDAHESGLACYFLGPVMLLKARPETSQQINDGQQRLITFSLLMAALCHRFSHIVPRDTDKEARANRLLFDRGPSQSARFEDVAKGKYDQRILPPQVNRDKYRQIIRGNKIRGNGRLITAWHKVKHFIEHMDAGTLNTFFEFLLAGVEVAVLTVPPEVDKHRVFETLNARGKRLNAVDLIRNLLYSHFSEQEDDTRRVIVHDNLERSRRILDKRTAVKSYYHCYLQCTYGHLKKKRLYREFRNKLMAEVRGEEAGKYAYQLAKGLGREESAWLFQAVHSGQISERLAGRLPKIKGKRDLAVLLRKLGEYSVAHPLCFALLHRFEDTIDSDMERDVRTRVDRGLKNLNAFVMRSVFVTNPFQPSRIAADLAACSRNVFKSTDLASLDIVGHLRQCDKWGVFNDKEFIRRVTEVEWDRNSKKKARLYLFGINEHQQRGPSGVSFDDSSVEHVLPKASEYWQSWDGFNDANAEEFIYRTGNIVLISKPENRSDAAFNSCYDKKQKAYKQSSVLMARKVAQEHNEWTPTIVKKRSKQLAQTAAGIWKFSG